MKSALIVIYSILILTACTSTKYVEVPVESIKTEYVNKIQYDSIYIHDSIDRYRSNDTVYYTTYRYIDKWHNRIDTVLKTDTVKIPVIQEVSTIKEVNKLTLLQKSFMYFGFIVFIFTLLYIILRVYGKFKSI